MGILLKKGSLQQVTAYYDSDWVACPNTKRSMTNEYQASAADEKVNDVSNFNQGNYQGKITSTPRVRGTQIFLEFTERQFEFVAAE